MEDCLVYQLTILEAVSALPLELLPVPPDPNQSNAAGWALLIMMAGLIIFELWALGTGRPTISQWVQRKTRGRSWWKLFGIVSIGLLLWHLFEGGPI